MNERREALTVVPSGSEEGKLLLAEAKDYISQPRGESKKRRVRNYTGTRLFKEEPQRYRLIVGMLAEGVSVRSIMRACKCDARTIRSIERRETETVSQHKTKLIGTLSRVARMTAERMEEEIPKMNHQQLVVACGVATDKLQSLSGDPTYRIEHTIAAPKENLFNRMERLKESIEKIVQAKVIDEPVPALDASAERERIAQKGEP